MTKKELVYTVDHVEARLDGNVLRIEASGTTRTGGWTDPELVDASTIDGERHFRFVALPPGGPSTDAITPIDVKYESGPLRPPFPAVVRVFAETNDLAAKVSSESDTGRVPPPYGSGPDASA